jgi:uncharacterized protein YggE
MESHQNNFNKEQLTRFVAVLCLVLSFFLVIETVKAFKEYSYIGYSPAADNNTIVAHGQADVFAPADVATFSFGVMADAATVKDAQDKATSQMNNILPALKDMGIEDKDVKTTSYNVYPQYASADSAQPFVCTTAGYCPPGGKTQKITGYEVSQTVEVKVRDSSKAGDAVTKVGSLGASNISGIDFQIDDPSTLQEQARQQAIADAKAKAAELASDLGVRLDGIVGFNETNQSPIYFKAMAADSAAGSAPVPAPAQLPQGQNKITSQVDVTYRIR